MGSGWLYTFSLGVATFGGKNNSVTRRSQPFIYRQAHYIFDPPAIVASILWMKILRFMKVYSVEFSAHAHKIHSFFEAQALAGL